MNFTPLNNIIKAEEIQQNIRKLKNNKATGEDGISNEMMKSAKEAILLELVEPFYRVLIN